MAHRDARMLAIELGRFGISTAISASITLGLPVALHEGLGVRPEQAVLIAFCVALAVNFAVMRGFVFAGRSSPAGDLLRFASANVGFRAFEYVAFLLLFTAARLQYVVALVIVLVVSTVLKFCTYRLVVFAPRGKR